MVNEAVKSVLTNSTGHIKRFTVTDTPAIPKGTLLTLTNPNTAAATAANTASQAIAGIASMAKVASDGALEISAWTDGDFDMVASGNITAGNAIIQAGLNIVQAANSRDINLGAIIIGYAKEDATDGQTKLMRIKL